MGQWITTRRWGVERRRDPKERGTQVVWRIGGPVQWDARRVRDPDVVHPVEIPHDWSGEALVLYGEEGSGKRMRAREAARRSRLPLFEIEMEEWREVGALERLSLISRMREMMPNGGCVAIHVRLLETSAYDVVLTSLVREFRGGDWSVILTLNSGDLGMVRTLLAFRGHLRARV